MVYTMPRRSLRQRTRRLSVRLFLFAFLVLFLLVVTVLSYLYLQLGNLSLPTEPEKSFSSVILDQNGAEMGYLPAIEKGKSLDRREIRAEDIPPNVIQAVLAGEDKNFYQHQGVDPKGTFRALIHDIQAMRLKEGGSTISQQYVKNNFTGNSVSPMRKLKEMRLATKLEQRYSKSQILERYLSQVYFGRGAYGVKAAARAYFGTSVEELTSAQAAILAAAIRRPSDGDKAEWIKPRRDKLLQAMSSRGFLSDGSGRLSDDDLRKALASPLGIVDQPRANGVQRYIFELVRLHLVAEYGREAAQQGGFVVKTTISPKMQLAAEKAIQQTLDHPNDPQAALVTIDADTGAILAMYAGRDYGQQQLNYAVTASRPVGSAFKPFVLMRAIASGVSVESQWPAPACLDVPRNKRGTKIDTMCNYDKADHGYVTLATAIRHSYNTPFIGLIQAIGVQPVAKLAEKTGLADQLISQAKPAPKLTPVISLALGTSDRTPLQMASAYGTFATRGQHAPAYLISKVVDRGGGVWEHEVNRLPVIEPAVADTINAVLSDAMANGTGTKASIGRPAAGKTGTTNGNRNAWFIGYTPDKLVTAVWMGYTDNREMVNIHDVPKVNGGTLPAIIWGRYMKSVVRHRPVAEFEPAESSVAIDSIELSSAPEEAPHSALVSLVPGLAPEQVDSPGPAPITAKQ